jgi:hypothetical protein
MMWLMRLSALCVSTSAMEWWRGLQWRNARRTFACGRADLGEVGAAEAQQVPVEADGLIQASRVHEDVAEPHLRGLEAGHGPAGVEGLRVGRPPAEDLRRDTVRIHALEEVDDPPLIGFVASARDDPDPAVQLN